MQTQWPDDLFFATADFYHINIETEACEVVHFLGDQVRSERKWISRLKRKLGRQGC